MKHDHSWRGTRHLGHTREKVKNVWEAAKKDAAACGLNYIARCTKNIYRERRLLFLGSKAKVKVTIRTTFYSTLCDGFIVDQKFRWKSAVFSLFHICCHTFQSKSKAKERKKSKKERKIIKNRYLIGWAQSSLRVNRRRHKGTTFRKRLRWLASCPSCPSSRYPIPMHGFPLTLASLWDRYCSSLSISCVLLFRSFFFLYLSIYFAWTLLVFLWVRGRSQSSGDGL